MGCICVYEELNPLMYGYLDNNFYVIMIAFLLLSVRLGNIQVYEELNVHTTSIRVYSGSSSTF